MKQTAVDWMFDQLWETPKDKLAWFKILMEAKEMEKEQMLDCYENVFFNDSGSELKFEQYYKETYE
jgi:hypothetical protein